jgi:hypothetical protein
VAVVPTDAPLADVNTGAVPPPPLTDVAPPAVDDGVVSTAVVAPDAAKPLLPFRLPPLEIALDPLLLVAREPPAVLALITVPFLLPTPATLPNAPPLFPRPPTFASVCSGLSKS